MIFGGLGVCEVLDFRGGGVRGWVRGNDDGGLGRIKMMDDWERRGVEEYIHESHADPSGNALVILHTCSSCDTMGDTKGARDFS